MFIKRFYRIMTNLGVTPRTAFKFAKLKPNHIPQNASEALALLATRGYVYQLFALIQAPELTVWKFLHYRLPRSSQPFETEIGAYAAARWEIGCYIAAYFDGAQADAMVETLFGPDELARARQRREQLKSRRSSPNYGAVQVSYEDRLQQIISESDRFSADRSAARLEFKRVQELTKLRAKR